MQAEVDGHAARNSVDPAGKLRPVAQQPQPPVRADERLLRDFFRERGVAEPAPCHGKHPTFVSFHEFAIAFSIAAAYGGHGGFIQLRGRMDAVSHCDWFHLTTRQPLREIVTRETPRPMSFVAADAP